MILSQEKLLRKITLTAERYSAFVSLLYWFRSNRGHVDITEEVTMARWSIPRTIPWAEFINFWQNH